jgi:hypothetical protein
MPPSPSAAFTLREDRVRNSYSFQDGADRLALAVSFDEETDDPKTTFSGLGMGATAGRLDARSTRPEVKHAPRLALAAAPIAAYGDDEPTAVRQK